MPDLEDGDFLEVQGSGSSVYRVRNVGGVYSCTCPAWMHQSVAIEGRTCKHIRAMRGDAAEQERIGSAELAGRPARAPRPRSVDGVDGEVDDAGSGAAVPPPLLLAHKWELDVDLTGWWMSEKLDGVRAYWDGQQFLSRLGNRFFPPDWFVEALPKTPLDGELWGGRKRFQRAVGIVKRQDKSELWREISYCVFDAPAHGGSFEERLEHCREILRGAPAHLGVHEQARCDGTVHLREELARVEALGGEGLMMRRPGSRYEAGRSNTLLKVKNFLDAEARVLEHVPGAGRHKGRLGSLLVELPDGTRFNVGTGFSDAERGDPPPIGTIVTFRYQELSDAGVPRFPTFVAVRDDFAWPAEKTATMGARPAAVATPRPAPVAMPSAPRPAPAPAAPAPVAHEASSPGPSRFRRFELVDEERRAFWEIEVDGTMHRVRYGTFDTKVKRYADEDEALREAERRIAEKLSKGFEETD